jgi:hypothetical protein
MEYGYGKSVYNQCITTDIADEEKINGLFATSTKIEKNLINLTTNC